MKKQLARRADRLVSLFSGQAARSGYLAAVDQGTISLANFLATVILARNVTPTQLGVYGVGFTALRLVRAFQEGITIQPLNTYGASMDEASFKRYATSTSLIQILLAIGCSAGVALFGWLATRAGNDIAGPALFSLWFAFLWWQLQEYVRRLLYTRGDVPNAVINSVLANLVRLSLMVVWARQDGLSGIRGLDAIAWGSLVAMLPGLWQTRSFWTRDFDNLLSTWKRNWGFGRYIMGATMANWVSMEFYPVLTAGMISFAAAGAYRAVQNLVAPVHLILRATDTFLTPRLSKIYHDRGGAGLARQLRLTYIAVGLPTMALLSLAVLFPTQLLYLLYGDTYLEYSSLAVLMAVYYALWYAYWPLQTAFKAMHHSRPLFIANLAAIVAMFTMGIWFIYLWGVYGTVLGQALNALVLTIIHWMAWFALPREERSGPPRQEDG